MPPLRFMSEQVIFDQPYGQVLVDSQVPCVVTRWHRFANFQEMSALLEAALAYVQAHGSAHRPWGWVGDTRHMGAIPEKTQQWLTHDFNPRLVRAGVQEVSMVAAETVFGHQAAQRYAQNTGQAHEHYHLRTGYYESVAAAKVGAGASLTR